jgi:glycosyltransferase involved in cell wall biosynthesis
MTKLIVQIPCLNEEGTLAATVRDIPRTIEGIDKVEVLIIDDGSTDETIAVARDIGVDHIVRNLSNKGLARTFARGLSACLERGADIIVNTDGDNQYSGASIPALVRPIIEGRADIVIGDRGTRNIDHFSPTKKLLQRLGSGVVKRLADLDIPDAVSGFRAYTRNAALRTNIMTNFSYTIETIIHAGNSDMTVVSVPVDTNPKTRDSRLFKSIPQFVQRQLVTMIRSYAMYRALEFFSIIGFLLIALGSLPMLRFLYFYSLGEGQGNIQSLVVGGVLITTGVITFAVALLADSVAMNRRLLEATLEKLRRLEIAEGRKRLDAPSSANKEKNDLTPA